MIERKELLNVLSAPLEGRGQKPAQGEDEPPEEGGHHGVVQEAKDNDTRSMLPAPSYGVVDKLSFGAGDNGPTHGHGEKVCQ